MSGCVGSVSEFEKIEQLHIFASLYLFETIECSLFAGFSLKIIRSYITFSSFFSENESKIMQGIIWIHDIYHLFKDRQKHVRCVIFCNIIYCILYILILLYIFPVTVVFKTRAGQNWGTLFIFWILNCKISKSQCIVVEFWRTICLDFRSLFYDFSFRCLRLFILSY